MGSYTSGYFKCVERISDDEERPRKEAALMTTLPLPRQLQLIRAQAILFFAFQKNFILAKYTLPFLKEIRDSNCNECH
jgi:hypothetical protein